MRSLFGARDMMADRDSERQKQLERVVLESHISRTWSSTSGEIAPRSRTTTTSSRKSAADPRKSQSRRSERYSASHTTVGHPFETAPKFDSRTAEDQWKEIALIANIKHGSETLGIYTLLLGARLVRDLIECGGNVGHCRICDDRANLINGCFVVVSTIWCLYSLFRPRLATYLPIVALWYIYIFFLGRPPLNPSCERLAGQMSTCHAQFVFDYVLQENVETVNCTWQGPFPMMATMCFLITSHSFLHPVQLMNVNWVFIGMLLAYTDLDYYWSYDVVLSVLLLVACHLWASRRKIDRERTERNKEILKQKQTKGTKKIFNILRFMAPTHVAKQMVAHPEKKIADQIPCVTVLFILIEKFDDKARNMETKDLLGYLNDLFEAWDDICKDNRVTKIETWKEEYVCAVGVVPDKEGSERSADANEAAPHDPQRGGLGEVGPHGTAHTLFLERLVKAASAILARANDDDDLSLLMGMHTGSVYAGVIGQKLPRYRLGGDTMNTAARMMQKGVSGELQFGEETRIHLPNWVQVKARGLIPMKGKGEVMAYLLDRGTAGLSPGGFSLDNPVPLRKRKMSVVDLLAFEGQDSVASADIEVAKRKSSRSNRGTVSATGRSFLRAPTQDELTRLETIEDNDDSSSSDADSQPSTFCTNPKDGTTSGILRRGSDTTITTTRRAISTVRFQDPSPISSSPVSHHASKASVASAWVGGKISALDAVAKPTDKVEEEDTLDFEEVRQMMNKAADGQMLGWRKLLGFGLRTNFFTEEVETHWNTWHHHQRICHKLYQRMELHTSILAVSTAIDAVYFIFTADWTAVDMTNHVWYTDRFGQFRFAVFLLCRLIAYLLIAAWQHATRADFRRGTPTHLWWKYGWMPVNPFVTQLVLIGTYFSICVMFFISYDAVSNPSHIHTNCSQEEIISNMKAHLRYSSVSALLYFCIFYVLTSELQFRFRFHFIYFPLALLPWISFWFFGVGTFEERGEERPSLALSWTRDGRSVFVIAWLINLKNAYHFEWDVRMRFEADQTLEKTRRRANEILNKMMPQHVVEEIQDNPLGAPPPSHRYKRAMICQSDLVGFTKLASTRGPAEVVSWLADLFGRFDDLSDMRGVWKVETVGDAYIAGMAEKPLTFYNSPIAVLLFGEDMVRAVKAWSTEKNVDVQCRVGVHFGKCEGGIVGAESQRYHLFGELMTVLEILESTSVSSKVQVSKACKDEVERQIYEDGPVEGEIDVLGFEQRTDKVLETSKKEHFTYAQAGGKTYFVSFKEHFSTRNRTATGWSWRTPSRSMVGMGNDWAAAGQSF